jgi:hypothetical protein
MTKKDRWKIFMQGKFSSPSHTSFFSLEFPFLPLILKFETRFPNFFDLEYELWNVFSEIFDEFEPRKTSKNTFQSFCARIKSKYWEVKKSHGGRRESFFM